MELSVLKEENETTFPRQKQEIKRKKPVLRKTASFSL